MPDLPPLLSPGAPPASPLALQPLRYPGSSRDDREHPPVEDDDVSVPVPGSLISPSFTPPSTPGSETHALQRSGRSYTLESPTSSSPGPKLLPKLPEVECVVRARIPTTNGQEMFLHLYQNDTDAKEHLAIVFGPHIRSQSLDAPRPGETEMDRMVRGAYTGRLFPGRLSSTNDTPASKAGGAAEGVMKTSESTSTLLEDASNRLRHMSLKRDSLSSSDLSSEYQPGPSDPPLVRIHSECYTGETVWSARCDCGEQLDEAARLMSLPTSAANPNPGGVIIYLRQEGRGIGLSEKLKAYNLQDLGNDTVEANLLLRHPADARSYGLATAMLMDLGLGGDRGIKLLTNNPEKIRAVEGPGRQVKVKERVGMVPLAWTSGGKQGVRSEEVGQYLRTKIEKMGHTIHS